MSITKQPQIMKTTENTTTIEKLISFVNQRAGLQFADYGDIKAYRKESREITKDKADFNELLNLAFTRLGADFNKKLTYSLENTSGRLGLKNGKLEYCTGQYFPTEYRPAANRILAQLIWNDYSNEMTDTKKDGMVSVYKDGHEIRKALKRQLSRRVIANYFN